MNRPLIESLEARQLLSTTGGLTAADVQLIISQAANVSLRQQAIVVVDRNGDILGILGQQPTSSIADAPAGDVLPPVNAADYAIEQAAQRARTVALFESQQDAFTTRTARFIIQNNFPEGVSNTPGGPLYGVEFSNLPDGDVLPAGQGSGISGDPGGIPLYIDGQPVGGIGVAGDGSDIAATQSLLLLNKLNKEFQNANPNNLYYTGTEESDFDESVALAGAAGFMPPPQITANNILINGLRLPFTASNPATARPTDMPGLRDNGLPGPPRADQAFPALGKTTANFIAAIDAPTSPYPATVIAGTPGQLKNANPEAQGDSFDPTNPTQHDDGIIPSDDPSLNGDGLTDADILQIISQAVTQANSIRAAIRQPIGVPAKVYISVTDLDGDVLGVFRMMDATNFSFDVSVQKARTAAFFSNNTHAFSTRAIGFMAQALFPPGLENGTTGPLYNLQDVLSLAGLVGPSDLGPTTPNGMKNPLANGITIFPGGVPLYKNGILVGGLGVSGDGVDEDDLIAYAGSVGFQPAGTIRSDTLPDSQIATFIQAKVDHLQSIYGMDFPTLPTINFFTDASDPASDSILDDINKRLALGLEGVRLPYQKFPRNPGL